MPSELVELRPIVVKPRPIFCKPLNFHFPQIYRLHRSRRIPSGQFPLPRRDWTLQTHGEFSLRNDIPRQSEITFAEPISQLAPTDRNSLILRHHWSRSTAQAYLQGVEDTEPNQPIGGVFVFNETCFTLTRRATSQAWNGPMIFYLADLFEDDDEFGAQGWEMSASCDGLICRSDIFHQAD